MKIYPSHLLLLKGEDKTEDVKNFEYDKRTPFVFVTFRNGKTFKYKSSNFEAFKNTETKLLDGKALILDENLRMDAYGTQDFGKFVRVIFADGSYRTVCKNQVRVTEGIACRSRNRFRYLCELAEKIGLVVDGHNVLKSNYDKIQVISGVSVLHDYLECAQVQAKENIDSTIIYPFGFNLSQKKAVENAIRSKVSIIEGPPGTGKTQTILNIIANAVMNNETVAVVSNNNTATENVYEKLEKHGVPFIAAQLGNSENKEKFISNQEINIPDIESWRMNAEEYSDTKKNLANSEAELNRMLEFRNKLSLLTAELDELEREYNHYTSRNEAKKTEDVISETFSQGADAQDILQLLIEYEYCMENSIQIGFFKKLLWRFKYRIRKFAFLERNIDEVSRCFENLYYTKRIAKIRSDIENLNKNLESYSFDEKMKRYKDEFSKYDVASHVPLRHLISDYSKLTDAERKFAMNRNSHIDFVIFSKMDYQPLLAVEVDGYSFHAANERQQDRDALKNNILRKYEIPIERFATTGSDEKERLEAAIARVQG